MIVPMARLALVCAAADEERTLEALRELGCAHLDASAERSASTAKAFERLAAAESAVRIMSKAAEEVAHGSNGAHPAENPFAALKADAFIDAVLAADARRKSLAEESERLRLSIRKYEPYGDFDPELARELLAQGIDLSSVAELPDPLPAERLSSMRRRLDETNGKIADETAKLAAAYGEAARITAVYPALEDGAAFAAARDGMENDGELAWICGWVARDAIPAVRACAAKEGWGILVREPEAGETPPTLVRPPRLFRPVIALFDGLGISPAYGESDISVPFFCYFSLFFAMLVGDGGYGLLILLATLFAWRKTRPSGDVRHRPRAVRSWLALLTVFSAGTVVWGALSNTWFGAALPFAKNWPTVEWLADPSYSNMMLLCFTIGVTHLVLARVWNGACMLNDLKCLAEFGWAGILVFMYIVTNSIVGIFGGVPDWAYAVFGISLALVFLFTLKPGELKSRGIELGMLPLNIMGALGDIISYVRLFAVGLASVKVAQNFNEMALGLDLPVWLKILPAALILLVGHGLNFAMAGLSILVHAVRLNTLEFSNHKGISWAGFAFRPFRRAAMRGAAAK